MLPGEIVLPEATFTPQCADVNQLFDWLSIESDTNFAKRFAQSSRQLQNNLYEQLKQQLYLSG
jgi:hypothetical protein